MKPAPPVTTTFLPARENCSFMPDTRVQQGAFTNENTKRRRPRARGFLPAVRTFYPARMCGIATLYEPSAPPWFADTLQRMTRAGRHPGPDGGGFLFFSPRDGGIVPLISDDTPVGVVGARTAPADATLGLGHRRLSILDLSIAGHQPMSDPAGECWVTFNGEIYNYAELRAELAPR